MKKRENEFPAGWDEARVRRVIDDYETQSDGEALAENEAIFSGLHDTLMEVPAELVPAIRQLIAKYVRAGRKDGRPIARRTPDRLTQKGAQHRFADL
ncbi:MAG TPA: hypothetical protein VLS88_15450 [Polyangiales bacterium]|nr:hypothetical protein [Polyangiales bacterium]